MELQKGNLSDIEVSIPQTAQGVTAEFFLNDVQVGSVLALTPIDGLCTFTTPYAAVHTEGSLKVDVKFYVELEYYTKTFYYDVITPYLEVREVKKVWAEATTEEAKEIEAAVRHIINAHCGQSFGYREDHTKVIEGHGERALRLPERLVELTGLSTVTSVLNPLSAIIVSDGWYLKKGWSEEVTAIETDSTYWGASDVTNDVLPGEPGYEKPGHGHVIYAPRSGPNPTVWKDDYPFTITGNWGYTAVPDPVKSAAKLLVNDYACMEALYRDRYLEAITAADWRLQFSSRAWDHTGNVRADQLLSDYVIMDWAVI